jgi:regulator of cell morphogenesis and NO signaling
MISKENNLSNILISNHKLIPVLIRFGIFPGTGNKTIEEVCNELKTDPAVVLTILNLTNDPGLIPEKILNTSAIPFLLNYLKKTHEDFLDMQLLNIERHILRLIASSDPANINLKMLLALFTEYKEGLTSLIRKEEKENFTAIIAIYNQICLYSELPEQIPDNKIEKLTSDYYAINEKLKDMNSLMIKYLKGDYDENIFYAVIVSLNRLIEDVTNMLQIEEKLLYPLLATIRKKK